ncbi:hypothetical protein PY365_06930 [Roseiarcaceae bacterium H3SJ34-1]|uniref:hypothetical protein n=1 Tax=Terripilifer ovatus TaxID=3032367 RepID=UPI003AB9A664|nr:hypothetical protein [Roseiarcaceae bacterium H3SJ34-1]
MNEEINNVACRNPRLHEQPLLGQQLAFRQDLAAASEKLLSAFEAAGLPPHDYDATLAFHLLDLFYRQIADGDDVEFLARLIRCANILVHANLETRQARPFT